MRNKAGGGGQRLGTRAEHEAALEAKRKQQAGYKPPVQKSTTKQPKRENLTPEERAARRKAQLAAAEARSKTFANDANKGKKRKSPKKETGTLRDEPNMLRWTQ